MEIGRGNLFLASQIVLSFVQGAGIKGHGQYTTTLIRDFSAVESGIYMQTYIGVHLADFGLYNKSADRGQSYGLFLNPLGGGGNLTVERVTIQGFNYGAYVDGDNTVGNGDKTLWNQVTFVTNIGWSNGINKQAIGHTFINPNGGCATAFYEYGGAGSTVSLNGTINVFGCLLRIPENAGTLQGGMFSMNGTKTEYFGTPMLQITAGSGDASKVDGSRVRGVTTNAVATAQLAASAGTQLTGAWASGSVAGSLGIIQDSKAFLAGEQVIFEVPVAQTSPTQWTTVATATVSSTQNLTNMLIDARPSVKNFDAGGSAILVRLDQVWHASGPNDPASDQHTIVKVGNGVGGSDQIVVQASGSYLRGKIQIASAVEGGARTLRNRWAFKDNLSAPLPGEVEFQGVGSHPLMEWSANHNVPVDQYRGGEAFIGSIAAHRAFLWHHTGKALVNAGQASSTYGARVGGQFAISGFPVKCTIMGLAVFIDGNPSGTDTQIEWFKTGGGTVWTSGASGNDLIGQATVPATHRGLYPVVMNDASKWQTGGTVFARLTKPAAAQATNGALLVFYFPYVGT